MGSLLSKGRPPRLRTRGCHERQVLENHLICYNFRKTGGGKEKFGEMKVFLGKKAGCRRDGNWTQSIRLLRNAIIHWERGTCIQKGVPEGVYSPKIWRGEGYPSSHTHWIWLALRSPLQEKGFTFFRRPGCQQRKLENREKKGWFEESVTEKFDWLPRERHYTF